MARPKRTDTNTVTRTKRKDGKPGAPIVACSITDELYNRLEAFRAANFNVPRATLIARAIQEFLDREAPVKSGKKSD